MENIISHYNNVSNESWNAIIFPAMSHQHVFHL